MESSQILTESQINSEIKQEIKKWLDDNFESPKEITDETIYHYTSPSGLRGILENKCLWASNVTYFNDSKEFHQASSMLGKKLEALQELIQNAYHNEILETGKFVEQFMNEAKSTINSVPENFIKKLEDIQEYRISKLKEQQEMIQKISNKSNNFIGQKKSYDYYACCFTKHPDQLSQWRAYGSYAVGFDPQELIDNLTPKVNNANIIYKKDEQAKRINTLSNFFNFLETLLNKATIKEQDTKIIEEFAVAFFTEKIEKYFVLFKDEGFAEENERRLYLQASIEDTSKYCIRERNGIFFPYIELKIEQEKGKRKCLPIKEIYISPRSDDEYDRAKIGLKYLLKKCGYLDEQVKIYPSSIPFRP